MKALELEVGGPKLEVEGPELEVEALELEMEGPKLEVEGLELVMGSPELEVEGPQLKVEGQSSRWKVLQGVVKPWHTCDDDLQCLVQANSAAGTRTRVARVRAEYPNQLDYGGFGSGFSACAMCQLGKSAE